MNKYIKFRVLFLLFVFFAIAGCGILSDDNKIVDASGGETNVDGSDFTDNTETNKKEAKSEQTKTTTRKAYQPVVLNDGQTVVTVDTLEETIVEKKVATGTDIQVMKDLVVKAERIMPIYGWVIIAGCVFVSIISVAYSIYARGKGRIAGVGVATVSGMFATMFLSYNFRPDMTVWIGLVFAIIVILAIAAYMMITYQPKGNS